MDEEKQKEHETKLYKFKPNMILLWHMSIVITLAATAATLKGTADDSD